MLKITILNDGTGAIFELEGKLTGPWVKELECCWQEVIKDHRPVKVKLKAVTFIDGTGKKLLAEMHRHGAELIADGCMTKAITEEIERG